jgi:site-specific DNA recombinase
MVSKILRKDVYVGTFYTYKYYIPKGLTTWRLRPREEWVPITVPAIVERDLWEAAQTKLDALRRKYVTKPKHNYLMSRRIKCTCGKFVSARPHGVGGKTYLYYDCNAASKNTRGYRCTLPSFRADQVDAVVWNWVRELLRDREAMLVGYQASQQAFEQQNVYVHSQLANIDAHIEKQQQKLSQILDLYLEGDFPRAVLEEKRADLETQLEALQQERQMLEARIAHTTITDEHIRSVTEVAALVQDNLDTADFALKRKLVELLNITCSLALEDNEKVVYLHWYATNERLCIQSEAARSPA